jgi:hypothetical protein
MNVDINKLQIDLNFVTEWSDQWCLPLNLDKCSVVYLGFNNPKKLYQLGNRDITAVENQNDLAVLVNNKLNWGNQSAKAARRASGAPFRVCNISLETLSCEGYTYA